MPVNALAPEPRNAMLRPYEPTLRERIAAYLMGDTRPSPERRQFATGAADILSYLPFTGNIIQGEEAARRGDTKGAIMAALPIPGAAKIPAQLEQQAVQRGIRAFHGSPHDFPQFDISKIGSGEGAQSFGHGLYFAENEGVARSYRDALSKNTYKSEEIPTPVTAQEFTNTFGLSGVAATDVEKALRLGLQKQDIVNFISRKKINYPETSSEYKDYSAAENILSSLKGDVLPHTGAMYEVKINADPEHFLDWDKPITEQHPEVIQRLKNAYPEYFRKNVINKYTGLPVEFHTPQTDEQLEQYAAEMGFNIAVPYEKLTGKDIVRPFGSTDAAAAKTLSEAGIPGVKYLDQGSRRVGEGSRNYVVFDDKIVEIMRKYGLMGPIGAGIAAKILARQDARQEM